MNNKRRVYRIAKGHFYASGPYGYLTRKMYEWEGKTIDEIMDLKTRLWRKERWHGHKYEGEINKILEKYPVFVNEGCFSSFRVQRPGPFDDPLMKHNIRRRFGSRSNLSKHKFHWHGFAFDSMKQLENWFDDPEELEILKKHGFDIYDDVVPEKYIIHGSKQIWILKEQ